MVLRMNSTDLTADSVLIEILLIIGRMTAFVVLLTLAFFVVGWMFWTLSRLLPRTIRDHIGRWFGHVYYDIFDGAWKLAALGSAAIALTAASAFTTWGGLRSFTEHDAATGKSTLVGLSLAMAIAFGIQSIMLIAAWNIGDTFAAALPVRASNTDARRRAIESRIGIALGVVLAGLMIAWLVSTLYLPTTSIMDELWHRAGVLGQTLAIAAFAIGTAFYFRGNEFVGPYVRGLGVIVKNAVIWVMFLAAFAVSVFFSFDYHFNAIFDKDKRAQVADIRARQGFDGLIKFYQARLPQWEKEQKDKLLLKTDGWKNYEAQLELARGIVSQQNSERTQQRATAAENARQGRIANLRTTSTGLNVQIFPLAGKEETNKKRLKQIGAEIEATTNLLEPKTQAFEALVRKVADANAEAEKEAGGVEGDGLSGQEGKRSRWRAAMRKVRVAERERDAALTAKAPLDEQLKRLADEKSGLETENGTLASPLTDLRNKLGKAEADIAAESKAAAAAEKESDPSLTRTELNDAVRDFRGTPDPKALKNIQDKCESLKTIGLKVDDKNAGSLDCDPRQVNEGLRAFLTTQGRIIDFERTCVNSSKFSDASAIRDPGERTTKILDITENCLTGSGLPATELDAYDQRLGDLRKIRDDRAQSFTVTLNALKDNRNELLWLALAIAITVDSLIFFAGVFAATTKTSPLEKAGLRDLAKQVRQMPAKDIRWARGVIRDHAFTREQCDDPRINTIVTLGLERQIPTEAQGTFLVSREQGADSIRYVLHQIYRDELQEIVRKAEQRGELQPESEPQPAPSGAPPRNERVVVFVPRRSAGGST